MKHNIETFIVKTSLGSVNTFFGHPLNFLTNEEKENFDTIGYSGKLNGENISRSEYLNSLGKGQFSVKQTSWDSGDFREEFVIVRVN